MSAGEVGVAWSWLGMLGLGCSGSYKLALIWHSGRARAAAGRGSALFSSMASKKWLWAEWAGHSRAKINWFKSAKN